ncbi:transposase, partial [Kitasatospora indigofera]|uniref:transposase n=1 Tax=Kitasatospora indigofera TaxID=67307 RepID=UPI00368F8C2F
MRSNSPRHWVTPSTAASDRLNLLALLSLSEFIEPYLPVGEYGPYPERLRQQFEDVIWRFKTGAQWREMPREFGAWSTVSNPFRQWRDADVFEALMEGLIAE